MGAVFDGVASLVGKSLLRLVSAANEPRYATLETIREFGLEHLAASGEEHAIRAAHAAWCVALAERAAPELNGPHQDLWYDRLDEELGNLRAAFAHLRATDAFDAALRLVTGVEWFLTSRGHFHEASDMIEALLAMPGVEESPATLAFVCLMHGNVAQWLNDLDRAQSQYERALAIFRTLGDQQGLTITLRGMGSLAIDQGDPARAVPLLEAVPALATASGLEWHNAGATHLLGVVAFADGDFERAIVRHQEALAIWRRLGDTGYVADALAHIGRAELFAGSHERARAAYREALNLSAETHDNLNVVRSLEGCGGLAAADGDVVRAAQLLAAASALRDRFGMLRRRPPTRAAVERMLADVRDRLDEATFAAAWLDGSSLSLDEAIVVARAVTNVPEAATVHGGRAAGAQTHGLTKREVDVLRLVAQHLTDREIADQLFITRRTASKHVEAILAKLGVASRRDAAAEARSLRLI